MFGKLGITVIRPKSALQEAAQQTANKKEARRKAPQQEYGWSFWRRPCRGRARHKSKYHPSGLPRKTPMDVNPWPPLGSGPRRAHTRFWPSEDLRGVADSPTTVAMAALRVCALSLAAALLLPSGGLARKTRGPEDDLAKEITHDLEMNFNKIAPFGKEDTAKELQDHAAKTQDQNGPGPLGVSIACGASSGQGVLRVDQGGRENGPELRRGVTRTSAQIGLARLVLGGSSSTPT